MLFSSTVFLFVFLPAVCFLYLIVNEKLRNYILLISSLLFYAWGEPSYLAIMLLVCLLNYIGGLVVHYFDQNTVGKKLALTIIVLLNLTVLGYFKYADFVIGNINHIFSSNVDFLHVIMPIGISFFTFQSLSYVIDVYRKDVEVQREFIKLALYISFFPQLIAGPIVKYHDVMGYLENRQHDFSDIVIGLKRFIIGLGKKVLIANTMGEVADNIFQTGAANIDISIAWLGAICYTLQLYFDFSGYSDMAIGLGRIFGFRFLENFNYPYISRSITEFWRRWHISLGTWFKEYLYIPLGGNRKGHTRTYINLGIVFLATGVWHGANWTFIIWGLWHGMFLMIEKRLDVNNWGSKYALIQHVYTILVFVIGWVIFRADNITEAVSFLGVMFGMNSPAVLGNTLEYYINNKVILIGVLGMLASTPVMNNVLFENRFKEAYFYHVLENSYLLAVLFFSIVYIAASTYNPFIYFRF